MVHKRERVQLICLDESRTHQSFKDECDIRNIMNKYKRTGLVSHLTSSKAAYGDFTNVPDYQEALNVVLEAQDVFDSLPAELRARFANDPGKYLEFVSDPVNRDEMIKLGMIDEASTEPKDSQQVEAKADLEQGST